MSPTGKSYSFRSCVRASEAACGRGATLLPWLGCGSSKNPPPRRVPRALPPSPLFEVLSKSFKSVYKVLKTRVGVLKSV